MRIAIISDIHGNLEALQAVLNYIQEQEITEVYCLGDIVGYGANPNECLELITRVCTRVVIGNHDHAAIGLTNVNYFNDFAKVSAYWTYNALSDENKNYLMSLDFTWQNEKMLLVHATPFEPSMWHYVLTEREAGHEFESFGHPVCFIGHSHFPVIFSEKTGYLKDQKYLLQPQDRYLINVGSVGQPRDGNPRTCFCVYNTDMGQIEYIRLSYDTALAREKIVKAGLPVFLGDRLLKGF
jgi:predicted phosphodiesterase